MVDELDPPTARFAAGTTPPEEALARSRTTTAYDPLTTSLLAEVARTQTAELDPEDLDLLKAEATPEPTASPRLIRRK